MKLLQKNKRAFFDNELIERIIAGIVLTGQEVKSAKEGSISLDGAYVIVSPTEVILRNALIQPWKHAGIEATKSYQIDRDRELLLTKRQREFLFVKRKEIHAQVVPLAVYIDKNLVKIEIALARGLKKYDKKNRRKERDEKREVARIAKTKNLRG